MRVATLAVPSFDFIPTPLEASGLVHDMAEVTVPANAQNNVGLSDRAMGVSDGNERPWAGNAGMSDATPLLDAWGSSMYSQVLLTRHHFRGGA